MDPEGIQRDGEGGGGDGVTSVLAERSLQAAVMFPAALINMQMCRGKKKPPLVLLMQLFMAVMSALTAAVYTAVNEWRWRMSWWDSSQ